MTSDDAALRERLARLETDPRDAANIRYRAGTLLRDLASFAVNVTVAPEAGLELLDTYDVRHVLRTFMETSEACHAELLGIPGRDPRQTAGALAMDRAAFSCTSPGSSGNARPQTRMIDIALDPVVIARLPKVRFWDAYFAALQGVARRTRLRAPEARARAAPKPTGSAAWNSPALSRAERMPLPTSPP